jgi:hypothetical protein
MIRIITIERECVEPLFYRLMKVFMRGSYERSLPVTGLELDADSMVVFMQRVIDGAAAAGNCVIVGRGAPYLLRNRPDAFHPFISRPSRRRSGACANWARPRARRPSWWKPIDQQRATFVRKYFGKEWPNRHLHHLILNSSLGDDTVIRTVLDEIEILNHEKGKSG